MNMQKVKDKKTLYLISKMNRAFRNYPMLSNGDRVAVALSGGWDSLTLLHLLHVRKPMYPEQYDVIAVHIVGDARGPLQCLEHEPLIKWLSEMGYPYVVSPMQISEKETLPMSCQRCTWNRRSTLFKIANRLGCNKIAFGHHFDDFVETALLNMFYQGRIAGMAPFANYFQGQFALIRPLIYIQKKELNAFGKLNNFPPPPPECPNSQSSRRKLMSELLRSLEKDCKNVRWNIFNAIMNFESSKSAQ